MNINSRRRALRYFKYRGFIILNSESQNLVGIDFLPRYRIELESLLEILSVSSSPKSLDFGYIKDENFSLYFKNIEMTESEALVEFQHIKSVSPYGFSTEADYLQYVNHVFDPTYQSELEKTYDSLVRAGVKIEVTGKESKIKIVNSTITPLEFFKEREVPSKANLRRII